jgi:hypothetical protein
MAVTVTPVPRNLATKVTFLYMEFEDLFVILGLAVVMNMFGRFLQREMFGIPPRYLTPLLLRASFAIGVRLTFLPCRRPTWTRSGRSLKPATSRRRTAT